MNTVLRTFRDKCDYSEHLFDCYMSGQILAILELFQTLPTAANMINFIPKLITLLPLCLGFSSGRHSLWPTETWLEAVMWIVAVGSTSMLLCVAQMASHISTPAWRDAVQLAMTALGWARLHVFLEMGHIFKTAQIISGQDLKPQTLIINLNHLV